MEIVNIEARTFEAMLNKFEVLAKRMDDFFRKNEDKSLDNWIDNHRVCQILNISIRTLQTYRDNGTLPYTQICRKTYYKSEDVERLIKNQKNLDVCKTK